MVTSAPTALRFWDLMRLPSHRAAKRGLPTQRWQSSEALAASCPPRTGWHHVRVLVWGPAEPGWGGTVPPSPSHRDQHLSPPCVAGGGHTGWRGIHRMAEATRSAPCSPPAAPPAEETHCGFDRQFSAGSVPKSSWICPPAPHRHKEGDCSGTGRFCSNSPSARLQPGGSALLFKQLREIQIPHPSPATSGWDLLASANNPEINSGPALL